MATAAPAVIGKLVIPPITAAQRAPQQQRRGPPPETFVKEAKPRIGTRSSTAKAERKPAIAHTSVDRRRTGMPRSSARSAFSALALMATP